MAELNPKHHPTEDALELFSMGRLAGHELEPIEEHLLICESCRNRVEESDRFTSALKPALRQLRLEPEPSRRSLWATILSPGKPVVALAAACAVLLIVIPAVRRPARTAAQSVELSAFRGGAETTARARVPLDLRLPAEGMESYTSATIEVVDNAGEPKWKGTATLHEGNWRVHVEKSLDSGNYFVRAYAPATSELLREYPLIVN
jgi:hypothetical protein